ncbi:MAG: hypothetical protein LQ351_002931 [Letrouitia transgressa]|nr:MAG: hypothetical protein LQ351_002931 [Letrouitia transgressa]
MATEAADLTKVDSAVSGLSSSPTDKKGHRRASSSATGLNGKLTTWLEKEGKELQIAKETQKINWYLLPLKVASSPVGHFQHYRPTAKASDRKLNTSPATLEDKETLKKFLTNPPVKKIDLHFPLGLEVTARNLKGVTIKDALDAIHKQFKKKADDELENPILAGFEWDKEESWTRLIVHQKKEGAPSGSKKKNKKETYDD